MGEAGSECSVCNMCHGEGRVVDYNRGGSSMPENKYWMECPKCNGTGKAAQKEELEKRYSVLKKLYREASIKFVAADDKIKSLEEKIARIEIELKEEKMCPNAYIKDCEELTDKLAKAEELYLKLSKDFGGLSMQRREGIRGLDLLLNDFHDEIIHIWEIGEQDKEDYHERKDKNISDYFKAKDENDILKVRIEEYKIGAERVIETLIDEIRNLKIILAGAVCKNNPFVDKAGSDKIER